MSAPSTWKSPSPTITVSIFAGKGTQLCIKKKSSSEHSIWASALLRSFRRKAREYTDSYRWGGMSKLTEQTPQTRRLRIWNVLNYFFFNAKAMFRTYLTSKEVKMTRSTGSIDASLITKSNYLRYRSNKVPSVTYNPT